MKPSSRFLIALLIPAALLAGACAQAQSRTQATDQSQPEITAGSRKPPPPPARTEHWLASWAAAPQAYGQVPASVALAPPPPAELADITLRQAVRPTLSGSRMRIRFSNRFGRTPLHIASASVAGLAGDGQGPDVVPGSLRALRFGGRPDITIAPGAQAWSDPMASAVRAGKPVAISFRIDAAAPYGTVHHMPPGATWSVPGDAVMRADWNAASASAFNHIVTGLDVAGGAARTRVLVAFGDSITEGAGATQDAGRPVRYPELLAQRLQGRAGHGARFAVINAGISGNRLLDDWVGPKAIGRFRDDVLGQSGATDVLILIGINDIGISLPAGAAGPAPGAPSAEALVAGLQGLVEQARAAHVGVLLGTLTPFKGATYWSREKEARRQAVNDWIRRRGGDVRVVDFDAALRDAADPQALRSDVDSGDHLHPSTSGYKAMANAVDLKALLRDGK